MDELEVAASVPAIDVWMPSIFIACSMSSNPGDSGLHHAQTTSEELPTLHKEDDANSPEPQKFEAELCTVSICLNPMQFLPLALHLIPPAACNI